jgi:hypothetical protein
VAIDKDTVLTILRLYNNENGAWNEAFDIALGAKTETSAPKTETFWWRGTELDYKYRIVFQVPDGPFFGKDRPLLEVADGLDLVPASERGVGWETARATLMRAVEDEQSNIHGFPHWYDLTRTQRTKANNLSLSEKDFRDYDPSKNYSVKNDGCRWGYVQCAYVIREVLAHQSQQTAPGRFMVWANGVPGFWSGVVGGTLLMLAFWWIWGHVCLLWPSGLSEHEIAMQNIVNPYYYSSGIDYAIGKFWGSVITFVVGFAVGLHVGQGGISIPRGLNNY